MEQRFHRGGCVAIDAAEGVQAVGDLTLPAAAVMLSADAYERAGHDREILHVLALGEKEIAAGKG